MPRKRNGIVCLYRRNGSHRESILEFNLISKQIRLFGSLDDAAKCLWDYVTTISRKNNSTTVSMCYADKPVISFDIESRRIEHDFWDPAMSFILTELERRGTDGKAI